MKTLIIIPARGGSKRIPRKNVRIMCGKPLIVYSIENARAVRQSLTEGSEDTVVDIAVSTDDEELQSIVNKRGVKVIERPGELATDKVTLDPVINHALEYMEKEKGFHYDTVITMQATSPTLKSSTIIDAIGYFAHEVAESVLKVYDGMMKLIHNAYQRQQRYYLRSHRSRDNIGPRLREEKQQQTNKSKQSVAHQPVEPFGLCEV